MKWDIFPIVSPPFQLLKHPWVLLGLGCSGPSLTHTNTKEGLIVRNLTRTNVKDSPLPHGRTRFRKGYLQS